MIITDKKDLHLAKKIIESDYYLSFDTETNSLNVRKAVVIGMSCANTSGQSFYIVLKKWNGKELETLIDDSEVLPLLKLLQKRRLIMHNAAYDIQVVNNYFKIDLTDALYSDTMISCHTTDENRFTYGLKPIAADLFGAESLEEQSDMKQSIKDNGGADGELYRADYLKIAKYGEKDAILTMKLHKHFDAELHKQGLSEFFYTDEVMPLLKYVSIPMVSRGIPLDLSLMKKCLEEIKVDLNRLQEDIQAAIAPHLDDFNRWYLNKEYPGTQLSGQFLEALCSIIAPSDWPKTKAGTHSFSKTAFKKKPHLFETDLWKYYDAQMRLPAELTDQVRLKLFEASGEKYMFNILSKDHLKRLFFTKLKEEPTSTTEKGSAQVEDDFLIAMSEKYEWVKWLRTFNKLTKIKSTYIERFLDKQEDGIFYPSYFQHRTVSGRFGSDFQQLSRPLEEGQAEPIVIKYNNEIRKFFISGPGKLLVDDDFESLEPHTFAHVSGDEGLKNIFRNNHDFYSTIAIATEGLTEYSSDKKAENYLGKKNKSKRQTAKAYSLGVPYGLSAYALAMSLNAQGMDINDKEAQRLINNYLNAYPDLKKWMKESEEFAIKNGFMRIETGRIRHFPELPALIKKHEGVDMTNHLEIWKAYHERHNDYKQAKEDGKKIRNYLNNAKNIQIQGLSASIVNRASIALAHDLKQLSGDNYICAQIHDQVVVRCEENNVDIVKEMVQNRLENTYKLSIALKAVPSVGLNLAESKG
jgi:DNA polymerase I-like protein with 3'-5' exonuclease and polymerase domains